MNAQVAAGPFGSWLAKARASLRGEAGNDVPCGDCVGCCTSSYYIPLRPSDAATLEKVPDAYLTKSQQPPDGTWMMGYKANGHCPMFDGKGCSVYKARPQTCRDYDCRVFAAAGIDAGGDDKSAINRRVKAWTFSYADDAERDLHVAVKRAADFISGNIEKFPAGFTPATSMAIAVLAIKVYPLFKDHDPAPINAVELITAIVAASQIFNRS